MDLWTGPLLGGPPRASALLFEVRKQVKTHLKNVLSTGVSFCICASEHRALPALPPPSLRPRVPEAHVVPTPSTHILR